MTKQHFIALADIMRDLRSQIPTDIEGDTWVAFRKGREEQQARIEGKLAEFCKGINPQFKKERWFAYIDGKCGPSGGAVKRSKQR